MSAIDLVFEGGGAKGMVFVGALQELLEDAKYAFGRLLGTSAGAITDSEAKRNEMYQQAERILLEDVALVPIYHGNVNCMVSPTLAGPATEPNKAGQKTYWRFVFSHHDPLLYRKKN